MIVCIISRARVRNLTDFLEKERFWKNERARTDFRCAPVVLFVMNGKVYHQYRDIRGIHSRNAARLPQIGGADLVKFLPRFQAKSVDFFIVEIGRKGFIL